MTCPFLLSLAYKSINGRILCFEQISTHDKVIPEPPFIIFEPRVLESCKIRMLVIAQGNAWRTNEKNENMIKN